MDEDTIPFLQDSDHFVMSVHTRDMSVMHPYCNLPSMLVRADGVKLLTTTEELDAHWAAAGDAVRAWGYDNSILHTVDVDLLSPVSAFVVVDCGRYNKAGNEVQRFFASYVLSKQPQGWRIVAWVPITNRTR
jgi:hypothetical protein